MEFRDLLPRLGHRNRIAVVDAAFPGLAAPGVVTHRFLVEGIDEVYRPMAEGRCGKVAVCFGEALVA